MNVYPKPRVWLLLALIGMTTRVMPAFAQEADTCTIEGTMIVNKKPVESKDCFQNAGAPLDDFKRVCDAMEQTAIAVTKSAGTSPPKITHGTSCPTGAVAVCKGFLFMPIHHHIFKRSTHEMEIARESCLTQSGEWKPR
jgi:hypothetical protein